MELTIYPLGDSAFIERILNAVAIYTSQAGFAATVATAALLGVFATAIQSMMKGGKEIDVASIFIGIGAFILLFDTVTTRVIIEDRGTGGVRVVDNVPAGVSVPAYLISNIGNNISSGFESIYTSVSSTNQTPMTAGGSYADSLQALVNLRTRAYSADMMSAANESMGGAQADFRKSVYNYIKECTLPKFDLGLANQQDLKNSGLTEAIRFESQVYFTEIYQAGGPSEMTCSQAWSVLDGVFSSMFNEPEVERVLNKALNATSTAPGAPTWEDKLNLSNSEILAGLGGGGLAAQQMAITMIVEPIMLEAAQGKYQDFQDQTLAIAMTNAIEQRNISWAAQASFFQETIYPMMTFFEGLSFAITPFIAFLMVMGAFGIKLGIKYFMLLIWIQLWMPLLSIVDLFITEGASSELALAGSSVTTANSIYFMNAAYDTAKTWIGTGSYMATAVPMISLFLVSGSMYGAASLANSISSSTAKGADAAAESIQPDAMSVGALSGVGSASSSQFGSGITKMAGREGETGSVQLGAAASTGSQRALQDVKSSSDTFNSGLTDTLNNTSTSQEQLALTQGLGRSVTASDSNIATAVSEQAESFSKSNDLSQSSQEAVAGVLGGVLSGSMGANAGLAKLGGALEGKVSSETKDSVMQQVREQIAENEQAGYSNADKAELKEDIAANFSEQNTETFGQGEQSSKVQSLMQSSQEARQASDAYSESQTAEQRLAAMGDFDAGVVANKIDNDDFKAMRENLDEQNIDTSGLAQTYAESVGDTNLAERLAVLQTSLASEDAETRQQGIDAISGALGWAPLDQSGTEGEVRAPSQSNINPDSNTREGMRTVREDDGDRPAEIPNASLVTAADEENRVGVDEAAAQNSGSVNSQARELSAQRIVEQAENIDSGPTAFEIAGTAGNVEGELQESGAKIAATAVGAAEVWDNLSGLWSDTADKVEADLGNAAEAANSEEGMLDKVSALFNSLGDSYDETTGQLMEGIGEAFQGGVEAGQEAFSSMKDELKSGIKEDAMEKGLNELQADYFAESQMAFLDQAVGATDIHEALDTGAYSGLENSREALIGAYSVFENAEVAEGMADVINNASGNEDFAGGRLSSIDAYNDAAPLQFSDDQIQQLQDTLPQDQFERVMDSVGQEIPSPEPETAAATMNAEQPPAAEPDISSGTEPQAGSPFIDGQPTSEPETAAATMNAEQPPAAEPSFSIETTPQSGGASSQGAFVAPAGGADSLSVEINEEQLEMLQETLEETISDTIARQQE